MAFSLLEGVAVKTPVLANSLRSELGAAWDYALDAGRVASMCWLPMSSFSSSALRGALMGSWK
jgi:hypothetical protein